MIKLPIRLHCQPDWKQAVQEALARQNKLETVAMAEQQATGEYIRPVVLFQSQNYSEQEKSVT
ncbi:MAG: hypothetical protein ACP5O7_12555 [Phycisphaerae bacterium]